MSFTYPGSGNSQPRLLLPSQGAVSDIPTATNFQAILNWANTLKLSGSGLVYYAFYQGAGLSGGPSGLSGVHDFTNPHTFGNFSYLGADTHTFTYPSNLVTFYFSSCWLELTNTGSIEFEYGTSLPLAGGSGANTAPTGTNVQMTNWAAGIVDAAASGPASSFSYGFNSGTTVGYIGGAAFFGTFGLPS
jgi:hypothetical protein